MSNGCIDLTLARRSIWLICQDPSVSYLVQKTIWSRDSPRINYVPSIKYTQPVNISKRWGVFRVEGISISCQIRTFNILVTPYKSSFIRTCAIRDRTFLYITTQHPSFFNNLGRYFSTAASISAPWLFPCCCCPPDSCWLAYCCCGCWPG